MKKHNLIVTIFKLTLIFLVLGNYTALAQKTTIYIVRHAEKEAEPAADPELTATGLRRAQALLKSLRKEKVAGIYTTDFKRTRATAKPTADRFTLVPELYNPEDLKTFATKVKQFYLGHTVLIVGDANTVLPVIRAFGGGMPFSALAEGDYDMLFKLTLKGGETELEISYYGTPHHVTTIPDQYLNYTKEHFVKPPSRF